MAPWVRHPGLASFGTAIAYEAKQHPYGSTINCTQSYAATEPSMAPLVRNPGRVSFGTQIIHNDKHYPCASTIKCTQCHPTIKPFVVPCALYAQRVVCIVWNFTQTKKACTIFCLGSRAGVILVCPCILLETIVPDVCWSSRVGKSTGGTLAAPIYTGDERVRDFHIMAQIGLLTFYLFNHRFASTGLHLTSTCDSEVFVINIVLHEVLC